MPSRRSFLSSVVTGSLVLPASFFSHNQLKITSSSNITGKGISSLELVSNNLDEQEIFYREKMKLPVERMNHKKLKIQAGSTEILFYADKSYKQPIYHFAFNIPENQIEEAIQWLKGNKISLAKRPDGSEIYNFINWNAHAVYWLDASGNILEFIARHNLPTASSTPFSSGSILYASEIGLVVVNVEQELKNIKNSLDLDPFKGHASNFAAIGNEFNLLIVVEKNRPWLGNTANIPANSFPVITRFENGNRKSKMKFEGYPFEITTGGKV